MEHLAGATPFRAGALYAEWEAVAKHVDTATGFRVVDVSKVACLPGGRTCEVLKGNGIPAMTSALFGLMSGYTVPGKPSLLIGVIARELQAGTSAGRTNDEILLATKRALIEATAGYLFKCPDH